MENKYEFSYGVESNSIDINTLLLSQIHFTTIANEIHKKLHPDVKLNIKVIAPKEGSFIFQQYFEFIVASNLLSDDNIEYFSNLCSSIGGILALKAWLKGKKADKVIENKSDGTVKIEHNGESKTVTYNIYNIYKTDKVINSAIEKGFSAISNDDAVEYVKIESDNKNNDVEIKRSEFSNLSAQNEYLDNDTKEEIKPMSRLFIKDMDVVPKNISKMKWVFLFEGISAIKATISDNEFTKQIVNTEIRLGAGDSIVADLKVVSKFNEQYMTFLPSTYEVIKVHKVDFKQPNPKQKTIDD